MILGQLCSETMRLEYITKIIQPLTIKGPQTCEIEGIAYDSRQVKPGYLFVALHGAQRDGADYISDAIQRGAAAVLSKQASASASAVSHSIASTAGKEWEVLTPCRGREGGSARHCIIALPEACACAR